MGHNPYWPTCLATINTTIVPAFAITSQKFESIYTAFHEYQCVRVKDIAKPDTRESESELIDPANDQTGSVIFDYSQRTLSQRQDQNALEPNGGPQIILGIWDTSTQLGTEASGDAQSVHERLRSSLINKQSHTICMTVVLGDLDIVAGDGITQIHDLEESSILTVLREAYSMFRRQICLTARSLIASELMTMITNQERQPGLEASTLTEHEAGHHETAKGRYTITLGLLNLYVGAWSDALRLLAEGIAVARQAEDMFWQARAVETLVLGMGFLVWRNISFEVPDVCEHAYNTSQMMSKPTMFARSTNAMVGPSQTKADASLNERQRWLKYAPVLIEAVLGVYERAAASKSGTMSEVAVTESRIRCISLLILISRTSSTTVVHDLDQLIVRRILPSSSGSGLSLPGGFDIPRQLIAALPTSDEDLSTADGLAATLAVVSCLSAAGGLRKQAFMMRGLLQRLIPALKRARTSGASEAGVHPSVTPAASSKDPRSQSMLSGIRNIVVTAAATYGALSSTFYFDTAAAVVDRPAIEQHLAVWCQQQSTGDIPSKIEILLLGIAICENFGDASGAIHLVSALLRLAVTVPTVSAATISSHMMLSTNEQGRIVDRVRSLAEKASNLDQSTRPLYWDDFLVRDIQVLQGPDNPNLRAHAPSELALADSSSKPEAKDPFIFNPFARNTTSQTIPVVVAGDDVVFSVQMQNPLDVPIDVSRIELVVEGCDFKPIQHSVVLGPCSSQIFTLTGKALQAGSLKILGCDATIEACCRQTFPIMKDGWTPPLKLKQQMHRGGLVEGSLTFSSQDMNVADPSELSLTVIQPQPDLEIVSSSLIQPSVMLLEGEKRLVTLRVRNNSNIVASDFLLLTSDDNVSRGLRESLSRKDILPVDTYEVQHQLKYRQSLHISDVTGEQMLINPRQIQEYKFEIFGRPGLSEAHLNLDFARLDQPQTEIKQTFYTRQLRLPIDLTVNGSIEIVRINILPIEGKLPLEYQHKFEDHSVDHYSSLQQNPGNQPSNPDGVCMLSLDLRNVWPQPLTVELTSSMVPNGHAGGHQTAYTVNETIQPGHVSRAIIIIPRLFITNPLAPIPNLGKQRQFVVSTSTMSQEAESAVRENFWYREELLKHIHGTWSEVKTGRQGEIDLRKGVRLNLNARMIDVLRVEHVDISYSMSGKSDTSAPTLQELEHSHYQLQTDSFASLCVTVRNRCQERISLLLRLQPGLRDQPHNIALDLSRRLAWTGVLQRVLHPPLEPDEERTADLGLLVLASGLYEVNATVEEVRPPHSTKKADSNGLNTSAHRRIWHARSPCLIDAVESTQ